jgi:CO/xanthine dehydrogenase FAD-binding subunit
MDKYPLLRESCRQIGSIQIQNRATLGGNIANASPAGDSLPVLSVYGAVLWLGPKRQGEFERISLEGIMCGPGKTALGSRYIALIELPPLAPGARSSFRKVGQRYSLAISKLSLAVLGWVNENRFQDIRISAGSVSPVVSRARLTERLLEGKPITGSLIMAASRQLSEEIAPISDIRSTESYRRKICGAALADALYSLFFPST